MRRIAAGVLLACALLAAGCAGPGPGADGSASGQEQAVSFDSLLNADKVVMTTKAGSDLPKTWTYKQPQVQEKVAKLVAELKQGQSIASGAKTVPMVSFILDVQGAKRSVNVFEDDTFEFAGKWYELENAAERAYSAFEVLQNEGDLK